MAREITRRQFLRAAGASAVGAVVFAGCSLPRRELQVESPARMPEDLVTGTDNWYATLCRQCAAGCGIIVRVMEGRAKKIEGNPVYPVNRGKLCAKGQAGIQALYHPDRLRRPLRRDRATGATREITWDEAIDTIAGRLRELRGEAGSVVLATEPARAHLEMLLRHFLAFCSWPSLDGARHITLEPLDTAPLRKGITGILGESSRGMLPEYDMARSRYILSFGADFLSGEMSPVSHSVGYGEFRQGERERGTLVQIESRFSLTGGNADRRVPVAPGSEGLLALSLCYVIIDEGLTDPRSASALTGGRGASALLAFRPERVSETTGVPAETIAALAREFATRRPSLAVGGGPAAAQTNAAFNMHAVFALNLLVGGLGTPGGLIANPPPVSGLPAPYSGSPLRTWKELIARMRSGQPNPVKLLMVRGINPVYCLPGALGVADAFSHVPMIVNVASFVDETAAMADLVLPEHTYLEEWGDDAPNPGPGHEVVGFQQPVVAPIYDTRSFPDILLDLARKAGPAPAMPADLSLPWGSFRDLLRDGARQLQELRRGSVVDESFEVFWNKVLQQGGWWDTAAKAAAGVPDPMLLPEQSELAAFDGNPAQYPFHLVPFPSHSLDDGRCANLPWLQATPDPITTVTWQTWVEVGVVSAREAGLEEGDIVSIQSPRGSIEAPVYVNPALQPGVVSVPFGQGHAYGRYARGRGSNIFAILAPSEDSETGAFAWAATRVRLVKIGRKLALPKFEGTMFAAQVPGSEIIEVMQ